jgi:uncharacterized membrane protein
MSKTDEPSAMRDHARAANPPSGLENQEGRDSPLANLLKGKWLKHPLHGVVVHVPVALWPAAFLFDLLSYAGIGANPVVRLSFVAIAFGLAGAAIAVPTGVADWSEIKQEKPAWKIGVYHMGANLLAIMIYAVNLGLRLENFKDATRVTPIQLTLSGIGTLILFGSAYLGGLMLYDQGIGVARQSKHKWRKAAEAGHANLPPEKMTKK